MDKWPENGSHPTAKDEASPAMQKTSEGYALFPVTCLLMSMGLVWVEGTEYVGRATDGTIVAFGYLTHDEPQVERYLSDHGTPDQW